MAPGVALAQQLGQGEPGGIVAVFFGDGAACEGIFHESLNLAVQWELPLLYVCENNQWQAFVHRRETMPEDGIGAWARGHGLPVCSIDGNDVETVYAAALDAVAQIRADGRPRFIELQTYRQRGHFEPDDQGAARVRNTPLAEAIIAGTAVGAAASGLRPVIDLLFAPFMAYAVDALVNSAGKLRYLSGGQYSFPLVAMGLTGTGWCVGAQHNHNLEAMFVHAPGLKVVMPAEPADARGLLRSAIRDDNPVLFFTDLGLLHQEGEVPRTTRTHLVSIGQAAVRRHR